MRYTGFTPLEKTVREQSSLTGFTLVELLVMIFILSVLAGLFTPALTRTREAGRRVQCANNLRRHGIGWHLYLGDHDDKFPPFDATPQNGGVQFALTFGGKRGSFLGPEYAAKYRALNKYLDIFDETSSNLELFHCPNDKNPSMGGQTVYDYFGNSYMPNQYILWYGPQFFLKPRPMSTISSSHDRVYLEACKDTNSPGHGGLAAIGTNRVPVMVLFVDGHVAGPLMYEEDFEQWNAASAQPALKDPNGTPSWED